MYRLMRLDFEATTIGTPFLLDAAGLLKPSAAAAWRAHSAFGPTWATPTLRLQALRQLSGGRRLTPWLLPFRLLRPLEGRRQLLRRARQARRQGRRQLGRLALWSLRLNSRQVLGRRATHNTTLGRAYSTPRSSSTSPGSGLLDVLVSNFFKVRMVQTLPR